MSNVSMINGHIDNVVSDEEIVKALECCAVAFDCPDCPFESDCGSMQNLSTAAIDLINRLKADKEALINGQETLMKYIAKKKETIAELDAEIERLKAPKFLVENTLSEKEISEMLKMGRIGVIPHIDYSIRRIDEDFIKSEAIKKFAERLRKQATVDDDSTWWIANIDVDNLVKEMTESDSNDKAFWEDTN